MWPGQHGRAIKNSLKFILVTDIKVVQLLLESQLVLLLCKWGSCKLGVEMIVVIRVWESRKGEGLFL